MNSQGLLFVYNADSGLFNILADIGHKIFSPQTYSCRLCAISHGYFSEKKQWREFIESVPMSCEFIHRDEFLRMHPDIRTELPAVFRLENESITQCLDADSINRCHSIDALSQLVMSCCIQEY
jgi:hypothetical protein